MQEIGSDAAVATGQNRRRGRPLARVQPEQSAELQRRVRAAPAHSARHSGLESFSLVLRDSTRRRQHASRTHVRTVERWRSRFLRLGLKGLKDRPRPGHKPKFGPVVRLQLIALACEPMESENGVSRRTIEQTSSLYLPGHRGGLSWSSVQRILAQAELRPHLVRGWMHSPDPEFREKVTEITELYLNPPPGEVVLCVDEKTGMQALERRFADRPPAPRRARRREFEYKRHGTQSLFFRCSHGTSRGELRDRRRAQDLVRFMESLQRQSVWDNLNISLRTRGSLERSIVDGSLRILATTLQNTPHGQPGKELSIFKGNACETPASAQ